MFTSRPQVVGLLESLLRATLGATSTKVEDVSGGCGSSYRVEVQSPKFVGFLVHREEIMLIALWTLDAVAVVLAYGLLIPQIPFIVGLPRIKQHQMVNEALKDEIKKWHAITIITKPTPQ
ncbi:BolA-like protein 3 [Perkinsus olseni]|uniref:BolA-like protein 3 n=1 Tax=Perkinsus olseni TaxID=32597 RepID=A0A7J6R8X9_PEROL|nr:BolA-like protein 3 [Perkinsus olseni]